MNIIYEAIIGSKLKGNDTPESDEDTMGIFVATNEEIGGFDWNDSSNTVTNASPDGDDYVLYEVRKFFRLAAKSTPAILPFLGSHKVIGATTYGQEAFRIGQGLISETWLRKQANYVWGKWQSYLEGGNKKDLIEAYYIGELVARWLARGSAPKATLEYPVYFSTVKFNDFMSLDLEEKGHILLHLADRIGRMDADLTLPFAPNMTEAAEFLKNVRNNLG